MANNDSLNKKISPDKLSELINIASKSLNTDKDAIKESVDNGKIDNILKRLPENESKKLMQILQNPELAQQILATEKAQHILKKFMGDK